MRTRRVVFLDKDGTLVEDVPFNVDPARIRLTPGAASGLRRLGEAGYAFCVVSNQAGVAHGRFTEAELAPVREHLWRLFATLGLELLGFHYCPHHPEAAVPDYREVCQCRKPAAGLLTAAAAAHGIDLARSWMIGDILDDVEAGKRAGCRTILLDNGHETEWVDGPWRRPDRVAGDLDEAATRILASDAFALLPGVGSEFLAAGGGLG